MVVSLMSLLLNIDDSGKSRSGRRPPVGAWHPKGGRDFPDDVGIIRLRQFNEKKWTFQCFRSQSPSVSAQYWRK
jgi:hypothetical protein